MLRTLLRQAPKAAAVAGVSIATLQPARCDAATTPSQPPTLVQRCIAEAVGTGIIITGGCGVVSAAKYASSGITVGGIASVWGTSVALAVYATRDISGAHLNPAVTAALAVHKPDALPIEEAPFYVAAQIAGATIASAINYAVFSNGIAAFEAAQGIVRGTAASTASFHGAFGMVPTTALMKAPAAFFAEIWMTGVLVFMIFAIGDPGKTVPADAGPVLVGATVTALITVFGPVTGCGMNPARDIGPRLITLCAGWGKAALTAAPVYTIGPIIGAILGGALHEAVMTKGAKVPELPF